MKLDRFRAVSREIAVTVIQSVKQLVELLHIGRYPVVQAVSQFLQVALELFWRGGDSAAGQQAKQK